MTQVKRHDPASYEALDESLRQRYCPGVHQLFADVAKDTDSRRLLRQQVAEDMHTLIRQFADHPKHSGKDTYKAMVRIFHEQCSHSGRIEAHFCDFTNSNDVPKCLYRP